MKNKMFILFVIGVAFVAIGGAIAICLHLNKQPGIREFDLAKYQWEIENFSSEKNVGQVNDANTAIEKSKELWRDRYGTINGQPYDPIKGKKFEVAYSVKEECWHIYGVVPPNTFGGVPHCIVRKSGEVLAVWMDD